MRRIVTLSVIVVLAVATAAAALTDNRFRRIREFLNGHKEVPVISTTGRGVFTATINREGTEIQLPPSLLRPRVAGDAGTYPCRPAAEHGRHQRVAVLEPSESSVGHSAWNSSLSGRRRRDRRHDHGGRRGWTDGAGLRSDGVRATARRDAGRPDLRQYP